jgi:hypothetical protein
MEILIRYVKLSLPTCKSERAWRAMPTGDSMYGCALRLGSIIGWLIAESDAVEAFLRATSARTTVQNQLT